MTCRPNVDEILLSRILDKTIRRSSALDTESLCLVAGSKCFSLRADIHILQHDGNLIDASCLGLLVALRHFKRPDVSVEGESVIVYDPKEREPVPLSILHHPLCVTISHFEGDVMLLDTTAAEEQVRQGDITISLNSQGELCQLFKNGGAEMEAVDILKCTEQAYQKVKVLTKLMHTKLEEDAKKRDVGGLMAELTAENER
jgi:exosome complex component RRP45